MSEVPVPQAKIPRPVHMRGAHERMLRKGLITGLGLATAGTIWFAYYGIYKLHNWWTRSWANLDHTKRAKRIKENEELWFDKWEYWWRTGTWVGNGYVEAPQLPEGTNYGFSPRLFPRKDEPDPRWWKIEDRFDEIEE